MNTHKILLITVALSCISLITSAAPDRRRNVKNHANVINCLEDSMGLSEEETDSLTEQMYDAILLTDTVPEPAAKSKIRFDGEKFILSDGVTKTIDAIENDIARLTKFRNKLVLPMFEAYARSQNLDLNDVRNHLMFIACLEKQELDLKELGLKEAYNYRKYDRMIGILRALLWKRNVEVAWQRKFPI